MASRIGNIADKLAFVTAVEAGSFAGAAARLGLSRSAVAKAVGRLEERLGTRLLTRSTRRLSPTEDGRLFHARCVALLEDLDAAEAEVAGRWSVPRGTLRLAAPDGYGRIAILPVAARYLAAHPGVRVEMVVSDRAIGLVEEGIDLAIRIGAQDALPPDLVARVISKLRHGFYASPGYLAARGRPEDLDALALHDAIPYNAAGHRWRWRALSREGTWQPIQAGARLSADSGAAVLQAAVLGLGVAYLPRILAEGSVADGSLSEVLEHLPGTDLPVSAVYPSRRNLPAKVRAFLDLLTKALREP